MFNNLNAQKSAGNAVDDIFAETDATTHSAGNNVGVEAQPAGLSAAPAFSGDNLNIDPRSGLKGKGKLILVLVLAAIILGAGAYLVYSKFIQPSAESKMINNENLPAPIVEPVNTPQEPADMVITPETENTSVEFSSSTDPVVSEPIVVETTTPVAPVDTDGDKLLDSEEQTLGTNINLADSDADGLSDYEEIKIYGTNPLLSDTDSDGYSDGDEVKNGYNPKGDGKLN